MLAAFDNKVCDMVILLIWRIWQLSNDVVHDKEVPPVDVTMEFLDSYYKSLDLARNYSMEEILKGKMLAQEEVITISIQQAAAPVPWPPPPANWVALSVDGSFSAHDGKVGSGMILRRDDGSVIFAAYRVIFNCNEALEAEIHAIMQGMALALQHTDLPVKVQSHSYNTLSILSGDSMSRSAYGHLVAEIKFCMDEREFVPQKISRTQNRVANCMANYSHAESCTAVWMSRCPPCCEDLLHLDCNPVTLE